MIFAVRVEVEYSHGIVMHQNFTGTAKTFWTNLLTAEAKATGFGCRCDTTSFG